MKIKIDKEHFKGSRGNVSIVEHNDGEYSLLVGEESVVYNILNDDEFLDDDGDFLDGKFHEECVKILDNFELLKDAFEVRQKLNCSLPEFFRIVRLLHAYFQSKSKLNNPNVTINSRIILKLFEQMFND